VRVSVVIPTVPGREQMLTRATNSVLDQIEPCEVIVSLDHDFTGGYRIGGAAATRNKGLEQVETEWTAFLDDDDELYPHHVDRCLALADETGADLVYPWFDGMNADRVLFARWDGVLQPPEGRPFGDEQIKFLHEVGNFIPITVVVRTEAIRAVGGFPIDRDCEDWHCWNQMLDNGSKFVHLPERTWKWNVHGNHLSYAWS